MQVDKFTFVYLLIKENSCISVLLAPSTNNILVVQAII
jgi:hypothetical protein